MGMFVEEKTVHPNALTVVPKNKYAYNSAFYVSGLYDFKKLFLYR